MPSRLDDTSHRIRTDDRADLADPESGTSTGDTRTRLLADLRHGLARPQPSIPPKWFYDDRGSALFEDITRLPEYYPTEAERTLLLDHASAIVGDADTLIELGAGISDKTTALLDALIAGSTGPSGPRHHVAFDISAEAIREGARRLRDRYLTTVIDTEGVVGDLDVDLAPSLDRLPRRGPRLIAFLGGTLGNYLPGPRLDLLRSLSRSLDGSDRLLIGMDLVKDPAVLVRAYDDGAGVTAEFNRNVIQVLARELGADLDPAWFDHRAVWNADDRWIEMHLVANRRIDVELATDLTLVLDPGDHLLTEVSAKFTIEGAREELARAGLVADGLWTDGRYLLGRWRRADEVSGPPAPTIGATGAPPPTAPLRRHRGPRLQRLERTGLAEKGESLWGFNCASCHGLNGEGGIGPALNSEQFLQAAVDDQISLLVAVGVPGSQMGAYSQDYGGPLTSEQIRALTVYVRSWEDGAPDRPDWRDVPLDP